uniref:Uncharacterized protein n=1 Tax=Calcidiscus leptoporus TaxID=127549 RepID=A0A7S0NWR1_9EUKA
MRRGDAEMQRSAHNRTCTHASGRSVHSRRARNQTAAAAVEAPSRGSLREVASVCSARLRRLAARAPRLGSRMLRLGLQEDEPQHHRQLVKLIGAKNLLDVGH